jgi:PAS domain S-box-containing protein
MQEAQRAQPASFLAGGGEAGARIRATDWSATPLGPSASWSQPLKTLVGVMLSSNQPMFIVWGEARVLLYNDRYAEILGDKHPAALGRDFLKVWHEIREDLSSIVAAAYAGEPVQMADIRLMMQRKGFEEEAHFAFSYTPVRDDAGAVTGFFCPCLEITDQVLAERRRAFRLALEDRLRTIADPAEIIQAASEALGRHLDVTQVAYAEIEPGEETVWIDQEWNSGQGVLRERRHRLNDFGPELIADLRQGEAIAIDDVRHDPRTAEGSSLAAFERAGIAALVGVPVVKTGRLLAVLVIHSAAPRRWLSDEVALARQIAERIWAAAERTRAEAELRETSRRLNAVLENASVAIFLMDSSHCCVFLNAAAEALTGYTMAEAQGRRLHDVIHHTRPDGTPYPPEACPIDSVRPGSSTLRGEETFVHKSGRFVPVAFSASPIHDEKGEAVGTIVEAQDISERRAATAALQESEARFRLIADAAPQILWVTDAEGRAEFFNRPWFEYTGAVHDPVSADQVSHDFLHPDDAEATIQAFSQAQRSGGTFLVEHRIRSAKGEYRWFLVRGEPYRDPQTGRISRWYGASVDIHDRRLAEARLRQLNETLEAQVAERVAERDQLWSLSQDMFARADYDGMMSAVSPAWTQVLGWKETELLSRGYASFMHPADLPATIEAIDRMAETQQPIRYENRIATADGGWKHIEWTAAPEPNGLHFVAVGRDISVAKAREAELTSAQEALRQSQKLEAMGQLTGGVAHDFNNLLTPIIGSLDMLIRRGIGSERERRLMDGALQSAERAKTLVQRLLAFARRQPLQPTAIDLRRLITEMAELVDSTSGPNVEIRVELPPEIPAVLADANQLEMAILNLAVNARDAMPDGGTLTISAAPAEVVEGETAEPGPGRYVRLTVKDTGVGMDEATLERAIEPFFSTKGIGKGTGLGLSMVHGLALQLNGALTMDSRPGEGTRIDLWLPQSSGPATADELGAAPLKEAKPRGRALLVDDEELVRMSTADMLMDLGYEVAEAGSAEEALRILGENPALDLLVTDHLMPGLSGAELARQARRLRPDLRILIVSGYAEAEGVDPDLPRLVKPFRIGELAESLLAIRGG